MYLVVGAYQQIAFHRHNFEDNIPAHKGLAKGALPNLLHAPELDVLPQHLLHAGQRLHVHLHQQIEFYILESPISMPETFILRSTLRSSA